MARHYRKGKKVVSFCVEKKIFCSICSARFLSVSPCLIFKQVADRGKIQSEVRKFQTPEKIIICHNDG